MFNKDSIFSLNLRPNLNRFAEPSETGSHWVPAQISKHWLQIQVESTMFEPRLQYSVFEIISVKLYYRARNLKEYRWTKLSSFFLWGLSIIVDFDLKDLKSGEYEENK